jgi:predicted nuclease of predicted toxin-antitoxin system
MNILFDQCTPHGLRDYLPEHEVRTAHEEGLDRIKNGKLIQKAIEKGYAVLITADKKMRKQQEISGLPLGVVVLTRPDWPMVKTQVAKIQKAVREAKPGRFTTVTIPQQDSLQNLHTATSELHNPGMPKPLQDDHDRVREQNIIFEERSGGHFDIKQRKTENGPTKTLTSYESIRSGLEWLARKKLVAETEIPRLERNLLEDLSERGHENADAEEEDSWFVSLLVQTTKTKRGLSATPESRTES